MMTREEALRWFEKNIRAVSMPGSRAAHEAAIRALRPVSREQVERMRGEWISTGAISCQCSKCKYLEFKSRAKEYSYCPCCGAPMTDEAVQMVMERMETIR